MVPNLNQMNPMHNFPDYFPKIHLISSHLHLGLQNGLFKFSNQNLVYIFHPSNACYLIRPSHPHRAKSLLNFRNYKRKPSRFQ